MPLTPELAAYKDKRDQEIAAIIRSESDKLLLVIGPCSADREDAVIDYIHRLAEVQKQVADKILIVPRIYTGKPRTTGAGYKGMLHQPDPGKKPDMYEGIRAIRHIHLRALQETGLSCADEMLYPENHRYLSDLLSYVAVGARSVENQEHRLISSGLDIPVGMKNPMSGDLSVMINAIKAAHGDHSFIYRGWEVESQGNPCPTPFCGAVWTATASTTPIIITRICVFSTICMWRAALPTRRCLLTPTTPIPPSSTCNRCVLPTRYSIPCVTRRIYAGW